MSSRSQLDLHPDPDSLNAFVEQLLTEPERAQILTHLAGCSRCREVIFVAQRAVYAMEPEEVLAAAAAAPALMAVASPAPPRPRSVPSVWRVALIPAGALAAALAISVFAYVAHIRQASELAKNASPAAPQAVPVPVHAVAKGKLTQPDSTHGPNEGKPAVSRPSGSERVATGPLAHGGIDPNVPVPPRSPVPAPAFDANATASPPRPVGQGFAAVQSKAAPQVGGQQHIAGRMAGAAGAARNAQAQTESAAATPTSNATELDSVSVSQLQVESAPQDSLSVASRKAMGKAAVARQELPPILPSGLRATSSVSAQHRTVAIDSLGAVFFSADAGFHWEAVAQQWEGRALVVRAPANPQLNSVGIATLAAGHTSKPKESSSAKSGSLADTIPLFEMMTEGNHTWVSADGKIWKEKSF